MKTLLLTALLALTCSNAYGVTAFLVNSYVTGNTKQCIYNALGSRYTLTVKSYQMCPLTIEV